VIGAELARCMIVSVAAAPRLWATGIEQAPSLASSIRASRMSATLWSCRNTPNCKAGCGRQPTRRGAAKRGTTGSCGPIPRPLGGRPAPGGARRRTAPSDAQRSRGPRRPSAADSRLGDAVPVPEREARGPMPEGERSEPGAQRSPRGRGSSRLCEGTRKRLKSRAAAESGEGVDGPRPRDSEAREGRQAGLARFPAPDSRGTGERPPIR
jgi:hypothetical protein